MYDRSVKWDGAWVHPKQDMRTDTNGDLYSVLIGQLTPISKLSLFIYIVIKLTSFATASFIVKNERICPQNCLCSDSSFYKCLWNHIFW